MDHPRRIISTSLHRARSTQRICGRNISAKRAVSSVDAVRYPALLGSMNECFGPAQQFSKLILIDQKIEHRGQRARRKH
jgi:hypothetical protein